MTNTMKNKLKGFEIKKPQNENVKTCKDYIKEYIHFHKSFPGTICKVCGKQDLGPYYEIHKNDKWTFICKECVDEISKVKNYDCIDYIGLDDIK